MAMLATDDPLGSRLFIVCGRSVEEDTIKAAFLPYGNVQNIKLIKDKGVCYVKYDKASSAALAMENLNGAVLNNGRGPKLKVLLAEAPTPRGAQQASKLLLPEEQSPTDPDNIPARSRLFLVVPKTAEAKLIHEELARYPDLEYCKTDLIASKGVVFVKYSKASSALRALEEIAARGMLASYKVKVMLAEPKTKRQRPDQLAAMGLFGPIGALAGHLPPLGLDATGAMRLSPAAASQFGAYGLNAASSAVLAAQQAAALSGAGADYTPLQSFAGFNSATNLAAAAAAAAAAAGGGTGMELGSQMGGLGFGLGPGGLMPQLSPHDAAGAMAGAAGMGGQLTAAAAAAAAAAGAGSGGSGAFQSSPGNTSMGSVNSAVTNFQLGPFMGLSPGGTPHPNPMMQAHQYGQPGMQDFAAAAAAAAAAAGPPLSQQRLFVVVHKSVSEDQLKLLFRQYPGMEYCDLKRDKTTGKSKGYCYVNYSTPTAAAAAVNDLNGIEFPVGSGFRLKVMFAEIMTGGGSGGGSSAGSATVNLLRSNSSRSSLRTPSAGHLGALVRVGSGPVGVQHGSGTLGGQPSIGAVGSQLMIAASGPSSTGAAAVGGSRGHSPAATPLHTQQQQQRQQQQRSLSGAELAHVADSLSSMSLPSMSAAMTPTMVGIGSGAPGSDAVTAAAAAHHFGDLDGSAAAVGAGPVSSSVARELMFNVC